MKIVLKKPSDLSGITKILTIEDVVFSGVKTTSNLEVDSMKKLAKSQTKKKNLKLSYGCGHIVVIHGTPRDPITVAVLRTATDHPKYPPVCRSWTTSSN